MEIPGRSKCGSRVPVVHDPLHVPVSSLRLRLDAFSLGVHPETAAGLFVCTDSEVSDHVAWRRTVRTARLRSSFTMGWFRFRTSSSNV